MEEPLRLLLFEQSDTSNQNQWMFSKKSSIEHGVPQDSVLGSLLFNIDLIDLFYECEESNIASYAHDAPFRPFWYGLAWSITDQCIIGFSMPFLFSEMLR